MNVLERYQIAGEGATDIAATIEAGIREGRIPAGAHLPPVRTLAVALHVSPATAAAAYGVLRSRGLVITGGRRGTRVRERPPLPVRSVAPLPDDVRNLRHGNPNPEFLPDLTNFVGAGRTRLYGEEANVPELLDLSRVRLRADGIPADEIAIVAGALDGVERVLQTHVSPGDKIAVEDPGYSNVYDLCSAMGLNLVGFDVDDEGPVPAALDTALRSGVRAVVVTPRAHNPTGALISPERAEDLRLVLGRYPHVLVVEDDHAGPVAGGAHRTLADASHERWAVVRSVSKSLGPDLRLAAVAGDSTTITRVEGRQLLGTGWVSHILQQTVAALWADPVIEAFLEEATDAYAQRRRALIGALEARNIQSHGRSGMNVWVPVFEEAPAIAALMESGWAVAAGERYRLNAPPALRITISTLEPSEAETLADAIADAVKPRTRTHSA